VLLGPREGVRTAVWHAVLQHVEAQLLSATHQGPVLLGSTQTLLELVVIARVVQAHVLDGHDPEGVGAQGCDLIEEGRRGSEAAQVLEAAADGAAGMEAVQDGLAEPLRSVGWRHMASETHPVVDSVQALLAVGGQEPQAGIADSLSGLRLHDPLGVKGLRDPEAAGGLLDHSAAAI